MVADETVRLNFCETESHVLGVGTHAWPIRNLSIPKDASDSPYAIWSVPGRKVTISENPVFLYKRGKGKKGKRKRRSARDNVLGRFYELNKIKLT